MDQKVIRFNHATRVKNVISLKPGDIVRIHKKIKEGDKERVQVFKGMVIAIKGKQSSSPTITVRRESQGVGVEIIFPLHLPSIEKIDLLRHSKVRQSKLYYMRNRTGKAAKMKVRDLSEKEKEEIENSGKNKDTQKKELEN